MKKVDILFILIVVLSVAVIGALGYFLYSVYTGQLGKAAVSIDSAYGKARVLINDKDKGETPVYSQDVYAGEIKMTINGDNNSYSTIIKPASGTLAVVKRDLGVSDNFSSGQNVWFEKSSGNESFVSVISPNTEDVSVIVDGVEVGKTPVKFSTKTLLNQNEDGKYKIEFSKKGYEKQEVIVNVKPGYTVNIRIDMFLNPLPENINLLEGFPDGVQFVNFSESTGAGFEDKKAWAKAVNYYLSTRGASNFGTTKIDKFNFFISDKGGLYSTDGSEIKVEDLKFDSGTYIAYLATNSVSSLSDEAKAVIAQATGKAPASGEASTTGTIVRIKSTPTNFLRVRSDASTTATELTKLDVGVTIPLLEEKSGWYKVEYETGKQGWISSVYAEKVK